MQSEIVAAALLAGAAGAFAPLGIRMVAVAMRPVAAYMPRWKIQEGKEELPIEDKYEKKVLSQVDIDRRRAALLVLAGGIASGGVAWAITGLPLVSVLCSLAGLAMPGLWASWQIGARKKQLGRQLEEACERISAYIRSGGGLQGALEAAAKTAAEPLRSVLERGVNKMRLNISGADVLTELAQTTGVPEMRMLAVAASLQQRGMAVNLGTVASQVQENMRARRELAESVSAITAENRMAGTVIAIIPFATLGFIRQIAPDFVRPLFTTPAGLVVLGVCSAVIVGGIVWIAKMGEVKV